MNEPVPSTSLTYEEFLAFISNKDEAYEFVDGRAVALASPSNAHSRLATVLTRWIDTHLDGTGCDTHAGKDVWTGKRARRPDIAVTCDKRDTNDTEHALHFPTLIIEIVSENEGQDFKDKFIEYQTMLSIQEYLLVDSTRHWVRRYYRSVEGKFVADLDQISGPCHIASIGYGLDIDAMYAKARA